MNVDHEEIRRCQDEAIRTKQLSLANFPEIRKEDFLPFPADLESIQIDNTGLQELPELPNGLQKLYLHNSPIQKLPSLPESLTHLYISGHYIKEIKNLPLNLKSLWIKEQPNRQTTLKQIGALPDSLKELQLDGCKVLKTIESLSDELEKITFYHTKFSVLPRLPKNLKWLSLTETLIRCLKKIPESLTRLVIDSEIIDEIDTFPETLRILQLNHVSFGDLFKMPSFPERLRILSVSHSNLKALPSLPNLLEVLVATGSSLESLPKLIHLSFLQTLKCDSSNITELPDLPPSLLSLQIDDTKIQELPLLPNELSQIKCDPALALPKSSAADVYDQEGEKLKEFIEQHKMLLAKKRCVAVKEELIAAVWHPKRMEFWAQMMDN